MAFQYKIRFTVWSDAHMRVGACNAVGTLVPATRDAHAGLRRCRSAIAALHVVVHNLPKEIRTNVKTRWYEVGHHSNRILLLP